jgi:prepilin-type N-terminal cleavage/methylation domain-containing protein
VRNSHGFSLLEVLVAMAILTSGVTALAQLAAISTRANVSARTTTSAALLAQGKMEQLRSLAWGLDADGIPVSDLTSDIAAVPSTQTGGVGLSASPPDALVRNNSGYCDFVDGRGRSLGGGTAPPPAAAYVRRWSIEPTPGFADSTLILQVRVTRMSGSGAADGGVSGPRRPDEARLVGIKTRKAS